MGIFILFKEEGVKDYTPPEDAKEKKKNASFLWKSVAAFLLIHYIILFGVVIVLAVKLNKAEDKAHAADGQAKDRVVKPCPAGGGAEKMKVSRKSSGVFEDLSRAEILAVRDYMLAQPSLKLTPYQNATDSSNYIYVIKLYLPDKETALKHLDQGGARPDRQALVSLFMGAEEDPIVKEFIVAPAGKPWAHDEHKVPGHRYPIPFNARPFDDVIERAAIEDLIGEETRKAYRLLMESYDGYKFDNCSDRCLTVLPASLMSSERSEWWFFFRDVPGSYKIPVNFELFIQHEGSNVSKWRIVRAFYNNQTFDSVAALVDTYDKDNLQKFSIPKNESAFWITYKRRGKPQPATPSRGPEQYEPDGQRYAVDGRRVEYMGWEFEFRVDSSFGLGAYDVRFNGKRIIYELSLQEASVSYTGYYPSQLEFISLDCGWRLGMSSYEMVRGVDCPNSATFFDSTHFIGTGNPMYVKNAVCVFELNAGIPLRRHYDMNFSGGYKFYGGMVNNVLVLRTISTVYSYDYIWDFIFYQNGVVQVKVSNNGYLLSTFYTKDVEKYGYPLHEHFTSSVHDHMTNWKVDLDVGGVSNSYETIEVGVENVTSRWGPGVNAKRVRKVLKATTKATEEEAAYKFNFDRPKYLNFYSEKKNHMGVRRGYRIQHAGIVKQLYPEDWVLVKMMGWSLYQLAVTRHKESERRSSSIYNNNSPVDPQVDFRSFIGNESIVNQDLVAWVTLGVMHIPHSEDIPATATPANSVSFYIRPFNYFDEDPSIGSTNAVFITPSGKEASGQVIERYGTPTGPVCVPAEHNITFSGRYDG